MPHRLGSDGTLLC